MYVTSLCMYERVTYRVVWIRHGVEGSNSQRVFIQHVEVSVILRKKKHRGCLTA